MFLSRLKNEISHFNKLSSNGRDLIISFMLFSAAYPILSIFINAFLWKESADYTIVALYNLFHFIGLPIGFYINAYLLNKFHVKSIYLLGCLLQGINAFILIFIPHITIPISIFFGLLYGLGGALFWANRTLLTLNHTEEKTRLYFNSLESSSNSIIAIIIPFLVGWFIIFFEKYFTLSGNMSYQIIAFIGLLFLTLCGYKIRNIKTDIDTIQSVFLKKVSKKWSFFRTMTILLGISDGVLYIIPTLIVLILLGNEGILGTVQSVAAIISAMTVYYVGRKIGLEKRSHLLFIGIILAVISAIFFGSLFTATAVLVFIGLNTMATPLIAIPWLNILYGQIESDSKQSESHQYAYIFDSELFLNIGRIIGVIIFMTFALFSSRDLSLRFLPLIAAILQIPMVFLFRKIETKST